MKKVNEYSKLLSNLQIEFANQELMDGDQRLYVAVQLLGTDTYMAMTVDIDENIDPADNEELMDEIIASQYDEWSEAAGHDIDFIKVIIMNSDFTCIWENPTYAESNYSLN